MVNELIALGKGHCERFFDEYMFPGCERREGHRGVKARGHTHGNDVHVRVIEQRAIIGITTRNAETFRDRVQTAWVGIRSSNHLPISLASQRRHVQALGDPSAADEAESQ